MDMTRALLQNDVPDPGRNRHVADGKNRVPGCGPGTDCEHSTITDPGKERMNAHSKAFTPPGFPIEKFGPSIIG
jgi:hypothetical protein